MFYSIWWLLQTNEYNYFLYTFSFNLYFLIFQCKLFQLFNTVYWKKNWKKIQMHLTYVTKKNFFLAFKQTFLVLMNEKKVQTKFLILNFMLYNPEIIINNLNIKSKMHILLNFCLTNVISTNPNMLKITKNAIWNFIKLKFKIVIYQNNSLNWIYNLVDA